MLTRSQLAFRDDAGPTPGGLRKAVRLDTGGTLWVAEARAGAGGLIARSRVRNEYSLLTMMGDTQGDLGGVLVPQAVVEDADGLLLLFPDTGGVPLSWADPHPDIGTFLDLAISLAHCLERVHRHGIVHTGLDPDEVVVDPDGTVWLTGFGDASVLRSETLSPVSLDDPDVRLPYVSPEQTGRMNRSIDHRSDLYSLGVLLYEYLTGTLPFEASDAMGWVHAHIAQRAEPALACRADVPAVLSRLLDRLLSKNAADRYQSASGLRADLERCKTLWDLRGHIEDFPLAQLDRAQRFRVPDRLYGRETDLARLYERFEDALDGGCGLVLVTGRSGIGKSRLIRELHRPVVTHHSWFVAGKSDQYRRGQPYLALIRALSGLVQQILAEPEDRLDEWRGILLDALGSNGQLVIDVIPEVELLIGPQPALAELPSAETVQRFNRTFLRFVQAVEAGGRALVLFLDDLQWADTPSLTFLENLLTSSETRNLLVIGAYRDNEVGEDHPLRRTVAALAQAGQEVEEIGLGPLSREDVGRLVADALGTDVQAVEELAELVNDRTAGNPFFVSQFLQRLHQDQVIRIDPATGDWTWDDKALERTAYTDNVVELVSGRLTRLGEGTKQALLRAALLGARFELQVLSDLLGHSVSETGAHLREAIDHGLIVPEGDALRVIQAEAEDRTAWFRFLHDRVQEAAFEQAPEAQRKQLHLETGRSLLARAPAESLDDVLFDVVAHVGQALELVTDADEQRRMAGIFLRAGQRAMGSVAHELASECVNGGLVLLGDHAWERAYDLALALHTAAAEAAYLTGQGEQARAHVDQVLEHSNDVLEKIAVLELRIHFAHNELRFPDALREGREALELLGYPLDDPADPATFPGMVGAIMAALGDRPVPSLAEMEEIDDPAAEAALRISANLVPTLAISRPDLLPPLIFAAVRIFLDKGMTPSAAVACSVYGLLLDAQGQFQVATAFGRLAQDISKRYPHSPLPNPIFSQVPFFVLHWTKPLRDGVPIARQGITRCPELGDIVNAAYSAMGWTALGVLSSLDLAYLDQEYVVLNQQQVDTRQMVAAMAMSPWGQLIACLRGDAEDPGELDGSRCAPAQLAPAMEQFNFGTGLQYLWACTASLALLFDRPERAVEAGRKAMPYEMAVIGAASMISNRFVLALSLARLAGRKQGEERDALVAECQALVTSEEAPHLAFAHLAELNPANFGHRWMLVQAELAAVAGDRDRALDLFDQAAEAAREHAMLMEHGLALELAARFHLGLGRKRLARVYVEDARDAWEEWGALAKVADLEEHFSELLGKRSAATTASVSAGAQPRGSSSLDLATVVKASEAVSSALILDELLDRLMRILMENAGARRAVLLLPRDTGLRVVAEGTIEDDRVQVVDEPLTGSVPLATAVVNFVARTLDAVVIGDAARTQRFASDAWLHGSAVRSLLCAPLINQGELSAVVYLENDLAAEAFTPDRVELLRTLAGQAAIAIDNARLYQELREQTDELAAKNQALTELDRLRDQFLANTSHELRTPLNGIIGIAESLIEGATGPLPESTTDNLGLVVSSARRLSNLVNDLLDFSTLQHGKPSLQPRAVDLHTMARTVMGLSQWIIGDKDLTLVNDVPLDLPAVMADEGRLEQILTNLVGNAVKFTETGSVRVRAHVDGDMVRVEVVDTGIGIRQEVQDRIFESFEQADGSTSRLFGGTGLGLAVARELVHLHGGDIGVQSQPGKGSTFWFSLEATDQQPERVDDAMLLHSVREDGRPTPSGGPDAQPVFVPERSSEAHKILVVDDDATNLQVLVNQLTVRGFEVEAALYGVQALNLIDGGFVPDLVLLDVMMPTMTGYDVTRNLRQRYSASELPIVLLTAKTLVRDLIEGLDAGANDYLTKPFSSGELMARLRTHLNLTTINRAVSRFVPGDFLRLLERESIVDVRLGDSVERTMSVLFSDIRAFTSMSERMTPRENFRFINEYLGFMEPVVLDHHGFIDKFIGDAVMALFDRSADDAVRAGIGMLRQVSRYNSVRRNRGERAIRIGVGVNSGNLMLGTVGGERRMDGTVISDAVNLGSRLESLTKKYGVNLLITEYTHGLLQDPELYRLRLLDRISVRGRRMPVTIYEVFDADSPEDLVAKLETRGAFEEGVNLFHQGDYLGAHQAFLGVMHRNPTDLAAENYVDRCRRRVRTESDDGLM